MANITCTLAKIVPLTCHGHSRPVTHLNFSSSMREDEFYIISACKGIDLLLRGYFLANIPKTIILCSEMVLLGIGKPPVSKDPIEIVLSKCTGSAHS
jgi:hypothetical protein